jgi:hypothetical protein
VGSTIINTSLPGSGSAPLPANYDHGIIVATNTPRFRGLSGDLFFFVQDSPTSWEAWIDPDGTGVTLTKMFFAH